MIIVLLLVTRLVDARPACSSQTLSPAGSRDHTAHLGYVLLGSALVLGSTAALCEIRSNHEYSLYLKTADPLRIGTHYDNAERYRNLSNIAMVGAEACAIGLVVYLVKQRHQEEPSPNSVRITMAVCQQRAEVSLRW